MTTDAERFDRLPKWAQSEITRLKSNVNYWKAKATAGPDDSDTFVWNGLGDMTPLGDSPTVAFYPKSIQRGGIESGFHARIDGKRLRVTSPGAEMVLIHPSASNSFYVEVDQR